MRKGKIKTPLADGIPGAGDASHIMVVICGIRNIRSKEEKKKKNFTWFVSFIVFSNVLVGDKYGGLERSKWDEAWHQK